MIFTILLNTVYYILSPILERFPVSTGFSDDVSQAFVFFGSKTTILQPIFPFDTLAQIILLTIAIELAIFVFKSTKWIISHIPYIGGRG